MKYVIALMVVAFLTLFALNARADNLAFRHNGVELQVGESFGGSVVEAVSPSNGSTSNTYTVNLVARVRHGRTPFAFEQMIIIPHGLMSSLLLDVWRGDRWRAHLDLGVFVPIHGQHVSAKSIDRSWDIVPGLGAEVKVHERMVVTADWRIFLPDPTTVPQTYGDFVRPIYKDAQRGGQLWLGANVVF